MKGVLKITLLLLFIVLVAACGRKKNTFMNRNFHAVTAEYNALYNGGVAYDQGKAELAYSYRDNFWEILPIERIEIKEDLDTPGATENANFNRSEEKAVKAIQKHSIYIDGKEYNPQIDEAYMMLGKSRYFDGRFIPALDAFNFILNKYPTSNNVNNAKVWKAKTNIRLNNEEVALENLAEMFEEEELDKEVLADGAAMMAQAYVNLDSMPQALEYMKMATDNVRNNELKGRYLFIKGQLYDHLEQKDSANMAYDEVIELNRKSPRAYMINAHISKARNFDYEKQDRIALLELLQELEEDRENRPFLDKIYNQIGEYYLGTKNIDTAVMYYNKSIQTYRNDQILQARNYKTLAEINFDRAEYRMAGAYYDSTLSQLEPKTREWRRITKKRENLDDVIKYEDIAMNNDSILRIAGMSLAQREAFFSAYIKKLKAQVIKDSIAASRSEKRGIANQEFLGNSPIKGAGPTEGGTFYFYNPTTVAFGKLEFEKVWGERALEDNWRTSENEFSNNEENPFEGDGEISLTEGARFKIETYLAAIPTDQAELDTLKIDRDFAYYQLGLIYKEKFKEYPLAASRLEKLLTFNPEERLVLPAKYNLYKIYGQMERTAQADQYKNDILNNYAESRYAEILRNPNTQLATDESSPQFKYKALYEQFEAGKYQYVLDTTEDYILQYNGNDIVPKLEMLKATALARRDGFIAYKKALNFVALTYPNSEEGKGADALLKNVIPKLAQSKFSNDEETEIFKLVYRFSVSESEQAIALEKKLAKAIEDYKYTNMDTSVDYYNPDTVFVVVHGLNTLLGARGFGENLKEAKAYKVMRPHFEISTANYKIVQFHKNLEDYLKRDTTATPTNPQK